MNDTKILPFCDKPFSTMYNNYSFPIGIIQGNHSNNVDPWAYGKYINCLYHSGFGYHLGKYSDVWKTHNDYVQIVNRKYGIIPLSKKIEHMKRLINEGYYIMIVLDEYYIPGMAVYQKWCFLHDSLLIGYNDEKHVFYLYGRFADQNMHISEVPYNCIEKAISKGSWSFVLKYEPKENEQLDISLIRTELSHYLYSSPSAKKGHGTKYGIQAVLSLCKHLIKQYRETAHMDYKLTRGLMEQKSLMYNLCQYLNNNGYPLPEEVLRLSKSASDSASIIHILTLKSIMNPVHNDSISKRLSNQFSRLVDAEKEYIPILLNCLHDQKVAQL